MLAPLVVAETGDLIDAWLRPGNAHTADGALELIPRRARWTSREADRRRSRAVRELPRAHALGFRHEPGGLEGE